MEETSLGTARLEQRIVALAQLGTIMSSLGEGTSWPGHASGLTKEEYEDMDTAILRAVQYNGWFTEENVRHAFRSWGRALDRSSIKSWLSAYPAIKEERNEFTVGSILAGNVPLVGLHDVLCIWLAGHRARVKTSSQEPELIPELIKLLEKLQPGILERIHFTNDKLGSVDAVIATGSNNTSRYFEHYFGHLPRIVRKNRISVALLDGSETKEELTALGEDVFRYFGLGCRNVSKLYIPEDLDTDRIFEGLFPYKDIVNHNKYGNNYDYTRALWLLDQVPFLENGFVLLKEDEGLASPMAAIFYERYSNLADVEEKLKAHADRIQCVVGHGRIPFGKAQTPALNEYADGVDTLAFLIGLDQGQNS